MKLLRPITIGVAQVLSINTTDSALPAWSTSTYYNAGATAGKTVGGLPTIYQSAIGSSSAVTISIASPAVISWTGHGLVAGAPVIFTTSGALPTGLTAGATYYLMNVGADSFQVSATQGGSAVNTSGTQSGTHTAHANPNFNHDPATDDGTYWLKVGVSNSWLMFDHSVQAQSTNTDSIDAIIQASSRVDTVVLMNISAATARVKMTSATDGVVFDQTISLVSNSGIEDWYSYYFEPIVRMSDLVVDGMPPYGSSQIEVTLTDTGAIVACGECVLGLSRDIGGTQYGAGVGIQDYSIKQADDFGNFSIVKRSYAKRGNFMVMVNNTAVDEVVSLLAGYRATPIVYIGSDAYGSSVIYGFYKDFDMVIQFMEKSVLSIEVEGLT